MIYNGVIPNYIWEMWRFVSPTNKIPAATSTYTQIYFETYKNNLMAIATNGYIAAIGAVGPINYQTKFSIDFEDFKNKDISKEQSHDRDLEWATHFKPHTAFTNRNQEMLSLDINYLKLIQTYLKAVDKTKTNQIYMVSDKRYVYWTPEKLMGKMFGVVAKMITTTDFNLLFPFEDKGIQEESITTSRWNNLIVEQQEELQESILKNK